MIIRNDDFTIDCSKSECARLEGVLRLPSPMAYEEQFEAIRKAIEGTTTGYVIDVSGVRFMNSSGITGLSRLVLLARGRDVALTLRGTREASWQEKTLTSFKRLYPKIVVEIS